MRCASTFSTAYDGGVLALRGDLDLASHRELCHRLFEARQADGGPLRLDVRGVTFVDCGCLGLIERARRLLQADGRRLRISGASPRFRRVSDLAGYDELVVAASGDDD